MPRLRFALLTYLFAIGCFASLPTVVPGQIIVRLPSTCPLPATLQDQPIHTCAVPPGYVDADNTPAATALDLFSSAAQRLAAPWELAFQRTLDRLADWWPANLAEQISRRQDVAARPSRTPRTWVDCPWESLLDANSLELKRDDSRGPSPGMLLASIGLSQSRRLQDVIPLASLASETWRSASRAVNKASAELAKAEFPLVAPAAVRNDVAERAVAEQTTQPSVPVLPVGAPIATWIQTPHGFIVIPSAEKVAIGGEDLPPGEELAPLATATGIAAVVPTEFAADAFATLRKWIAGIAGQEPAEQPLRPRTSLKVRPAAAVTTPDADVSDISTDDISANTSFWNFFEECPAWDATLPMDELAAAMEAATVDARTVDAKLAPPPRGTLVGIARDRRNLVGQEIAAELNRLNDGIDRSHATRAKHRGIGIIRNRPMRADLAAGWSSRLPREEPSATALRRLEMVEAATQRLGLASGRIFLGVREAAEILFADDPTGGESLNGAEARVAAESNSDAEAESR